MGQGPQLRLLEVGGQGGERGPTGWSRVQKRVPITHPQCLGTFMSSSQDKSKQEYEKEGKGVWGSGAGLDSTTVVPPVPALWSKSGGCLYIKHL